LRSVPETAKTVEMRPVPILLVGAPADRDRLRARLVAAGFEIAAEADTRAQAGVDDVDAVIDATPRAAAGSRRLLTIGDSPQEALTAREHDVLARLADGLPNKAIAHALGISDQTVKFHVAAIIAKLGAANRTDAVRRAIRRGLVAI